MIFVFTYSSAVYAVSKNQTHVTFSLQQVCHLSVIFGTNNNNVSFT